MDRLQSVAPYLVDNGDGSVRLAKVDTENSRGVRPVDRGEPRMQDNQEILTF